MYIQWLQKTNSGKLIPVSAVEVRKEIGVVSATEAEFEVMWSTKRELQIGNFIVIYYV